MNRLRQLNEVAGPQILLRAFFGVTFTFAGLQKLANPDFFNASAPGSFQAQVNGALTFSPIAPILRLVHHTAVPLAVAIAVTEVVVGLATLAGVFARSIAVVGMALSLSFFLSISWATTPYYYGSDIVFFFGWTVLAIGGPGPLSLDALAARKARQSGGDAVSGRDLVVRGATGLVAAGILAGVDALLGRGAHHSGAALSSDPPTAPSTTAPPTTSTPSAGSGTTTTQPSGTKIAETAQVASGDGVAFTDKGTGGPAWLVHELAGAFTAFTAICTHAGCTVNYVGSAAKFECPCHGSEYSAATGEVLRGPATRPLAAIPVRVVDGAVYAES